ncbi:MAG: acetyl-CoA C-acyltransferase, partial [Anaerolineae bacterium]|nr:acetyl-CoA C-acyltransferase [Anaerolineae bacterium]
MSDAVILSAARTPIGKLMGALAPLTAPQLGALAIKAAVERAQIDPSEIDEVYMGQVVSAGAGQVPARQASILAGIPAQVGAVTENKACGSGLRAVMMAAQAIRAGDAELMIGGGMESMSNAPHLVHMRMGVRYGNQTLLDANDYDGLRDPFEHHAMGCAAEYIAEQYEVTREAMDRYALESHRKAVAAQEAGAFDAEMIAVEVKHNGKV